MGRWNDIKGWYYGWKATIRIYLFDRETYRQLTRPLDAEDLVPLTTPGDILEHQEWIASLKEGDLVCDCRFRHLKIISRDGGDVLLSDGSSCSLASCCPPDHPEENPPPAVGFGELDYEHGGRLPRYGSDEID